MNKRTSVKVQYVFYSAADELLSQCSSGEHAQPTYLHAHIHVFVQDDRNC